MEQELESAWDAAQQRYTRVDTDLAHFNISLLSALRPSWGDVLRPVTSMFSLWLVRPKATYPYPEKVVVEYEGVERVQMSLFRELPRQSLERSGGAVTVAGDITRSANALPAVEALLLQLAAPSDP